MKKLNITKEHFEKSNYYQNKYGRLAFVSESGELFKTETGNILKFKERVNPKNAIKDKLDDSEIGDDIDDTTGEDDEEQLTSPRKSAERKPKSGTVNLTCFDELKDYMEDIQNHAYNREVGAAVDGDGRIGSIADEGNIISWLQEIFENTNVTLQKPPARSWYDILIIVNGKKYYTNIKTTDGKSADNISSKTGVWYYLSGGEIVDFSRFQIPDELPDVSANTEEDKDYFLLVMYKKTKRILFTSVGRLGTVVSNFNNMPFQIPWNRSTNDGRQSNNRSQEEQKRYIAHAWYVSYVKGYERVGKLMNLFGRISGDIG